jgi:FkbM family methyltransferase
MKYQFNKLFTTIFILFCNLVGKKWKSVKGVYLPINYSLGFNTLRWIINGQYEKDEIRIIEAKLEHSDIVLEIGTGLGFVSAYCAKKIGDSKIYTFEANPLNVETAHKVFVKNKVNPSLTNAFLADIKGTVKFSVNKKSRLASSIKIDKENNVEIQQLILNDIIAAHEPSFLVMDIEGSEYEIFKLISFQSIIKIQFELHPKIIGEQKCEEIFSILEKSHFKKDTSLSQGQNYYFYKV